MNSRANHDDVDGRYYRDAGLTADVFEYHACVPHQRHFSHSQVQDDGPGAVIVVDWLVPGSV